MEIERRIHTRHPMAIEVNATVKNKCFAGVTKDISKAGLGIFLPVKMTRGDRFAVEVVLSETFHFTGVVVISKRIKWRCYFYGVQFLEVQQETTDAFLQHIEAMGLEINSF